jgi:hypothetical protein
MTIMIARRNALIRRDNGQRRRVRKGITTAHSAHPIVQENPKLWAEIKPDYPAPTEVAADPEPKQEAASVRSEAPAETAVQKADADQGINRGQLKTWARKHGYEVGPVSDDSWITDELVAEYIAARDAYEREQAGDDGQ